MGSTRLVSRFCINGLDSRHLFKTWLPLLWKNIHNMDTQVLYKYLIHQFVSVFTETSEIVVHLFPLLKFVYCVGIAERIIAVLKD